MKNSFTLVELLVVVALLAILAAVVILVLNPSELLRQARDSRRLNDLSILNRAINMYIADTGGGGFYGSSSVVYVSIPDSSPTCSNLGLPSLPSGWSYHCAPSSTLQNIDGSGWIPINFKLQTFGRSITRLPIDPINQTSTLNYYTYVTGGSFELTALLESNKESYMNAAINDGDAFPGVYSVRTSPNPITPGLRDKGLVGYWPFDEGSGTIAYDRSGYGNNGTLYNGPTWVDGKVGKALSFDGVDDYVRITDPGANWVLDITNAITVEAWAYINLSTNHGWVVRKRWVGAPFFFGKNNEDEINLTINDVSGTWLDGAPVTAGWHHIAGTYDGSSRKIYIDGILKATFTNVTGPINATNDHIDIGGYNGGSNGQMFNGLIDEVRIYNRALSDAEIKAIYEATK